MPDYTPVHKPAQTYTTTASVTVTGGQLLVVTGNDTVGPSGAGAVNVVGVAGHDAIATSRVAVHTLTGAVHLVTAASIIAAGDLLVAAATGQVATVAAVTTPTAADVSSTRAILGVALSGAAAGAPCRFLSTR